MSRSGARLARESVTIAHMVRLYCRRHHGRALCADCRQLTDYAQERLKRCPFQDGKTTCARCPVHCYRPEMRERVRTVMRYAGPRMIYHHPYLALRHLLDGRRKRPVRSSVREV